MTEALFRSLIIAVAIIFTVFFCITIIPPLVVNPNIVGAFMAGFVNPFAAGYATDVILCWVLVAIWVIFERSNHLIKHGRSSLVLGIVPGVAVGLGLYLWLRHRQLKNSRD
jgi:uncharacterized membrane protein